MKSEPSTQRRLGDAPSPSYGYIGTYSRVLRGKHLGSNACYVASLTLFGRRE